MRLKITHKTEYHYDQPIRYGLQRLRLAPVSSPLQTVVDWSLTVEGAKEEVRFVDHFGNHTRLVSIGGAAQSISVLAEGEVETFDKAGMSGPHQGFAPLWLFMHDTPLTVRGEAVAALAAALPSGTDIERLHALKTEIAVRVAYKPGETAVGTTAEQALAAGVGVCQDHAHVFCAVARALGYPARYVSGYLLMEGQVEQVASHAWAEAHVPGLGWVAFDPANGISPDERYVTLAVGRDYKDAMPVSGILLGQAAERLEVRITVEQ